MDSKIKPIIKEISEWLYCIIIAVVLSLIVRYFLITPTIVKQVSMYPTLKQDQRLLLGRWSRTTKKLPKRGDIITFEAPSRTYVSNNEYDKNDVIAKYENKPVGIWNKFVYNILEIGKVSYIKRTIALPGEHLQIKDGKVYINGELLNEPYLKEGITTMSLNGEYTDLVVPENCVFAMGDNRPKSTDCRSFGCIPLEKIESKVLIRFWPLNLFGKIE